jgi:N-acetylneuraminic acid mutarotase
MTSTRKIKASLTLLLTLSLLLTVTVPYALAAEDFWTTKEPMPTARAILGAAVVDAKIYAIGGLSGGHLSTNEMYDPATDSWVTKTPMPTPRSSFGTAVVENKIYIIGGKTSDGVTGADEAYDPVTDTWETKTPMPTPRYGLDANVVNGKIYLISGLEKSDYPTYANVSALTEVYNPITDSWTTKASIPNPVFFYASAVVDNKIYVIGGSSATVAKANFNQIYNADTDTWTSGKTPDIRVTEAGSGATTGVMAPKRIYVIGGRGGDRVESATQVYNPEDDSWTVGASMLTSRFHLAIAVVNDKLYALGGYPYYKNIPPQIYLPGNRQYTPAGYIPEFPSWIILPLFLTVTLVFTVYRWKLSKANTPSFILGD